jgi:2'-5' RNA ligase
LRGGLLALLLTVSNRSLEDEDREVFPMAEADAAGLSALLVPVSAAEGLVEEFRRDLDPAAGWGVPAHITALFPFLPVAHVTTSVLDRVQEALQAIEAFDCHLERTEWFDDRVLWLAPVPDSPFRQITQALWTAFPECPPYGGAFNDVVPHLTVGDRTDGGDLRPLRRAETAIEQGLPIRFAVTSVHLMSGHQEPNSWTTLHQFPLRVMR